MMLKFIIYEIELVGVNARRHKRYVSPIVDDDFDKISNENYDNVSLSHKDQFG